MADAHPHQIPENNKNLRVARIIKNFSWLAGAQIFFRFTYFALIALLARLVSIEEYALVTVLLVYTGLWVPLFNFGLGIIGVREMAQGNITPRDFIASVLPLKLIVSGIGFTGIVVIGWLLGYANESPALLIIMGGATVILSLAEFWHYPFTASERMRVTALLTMFERASVAILSGVAIIVGLGSMGFAVGQIAGACVGFGVAFGVCTRDVGHVATRFDPKTIVWYYRESWPLAVNWSLAIGYSRVGVLVLDQLRSENEVAIFNTAFFVLMSAQMLIMMVMHSAFPAVSALQKTSPARALAHLYRGILFGAVGTVTLIPTFILLGDKLIPVVLGTEFGEVGRVMSVILWVLPAYTLVNIAAIYFQASGRQSVLAKATAVGVAVNWLAVVPFAMKYGAIGIALANVISEIAIGCVLINVLLRENQSLKTPQLLITLSGALMTVVIGATIAFIGMPGSLFVACGTLAAGLLIIWRIRHDMAQSAHRTALKVD